MTVRVRQVCGDCAAEMLSSRLIVLSSSLTLDGLLNVQAEALSGHLKFTAIQQTGLPEMEPPKSTFEARP